MDDNDEAKDIDRVMQFAATLGLYGVLIAGKPCPNCGGIHGFTMAANLGVPDDDGTLAHPHDISGLLAEFAEHAKDQPRIIEPMKTQ